MYLHPHHTEAYAVIAALSAIRGEVAVAACIGELPQGSAPSEILLIPAGDFRARDGRPEKLSSWKMTAERARQMIIRAEAAKGDSVIDYEHQTLLAEANGKPAPASGWYKRLEWREGSGLWATDVRWTETAKTHIENGEYRYISPVFEYDKKTGEVTAILMAALTNYPALDGHSDLAARAAARFNQPSEEDNTVDRDELIKLLGLDKDASDEQINQAMTALKAKADSVDQKDAEIASLKAGNGKPDPAKFVPVETFEALKSEVATLRSDKTASDVDALIKDAIDEGKLLPVQEDWARELGNKDIAALKGYLEKTPAIEALKGQQSGGKGPGDDSGTGLTSEELAVCKQLGVADEEFQATKANKE